MELKALQAAARDLATEALGVCCHSFGVEACRAADANSGRGGTVMPACAHDERGAPFCVDDERILVSKTDEDGLAVCVWAHPLAAGRVAGIGIDLASAQDFAGERGDRYNRLLFSDHERSFVRLHHDDRPELGFAYAFSAKEAAFKSLAAPLRTWYLNHDDELVFDLREFELADATHERGTLRHAHAQAAMDAMGVESIELWHRTLDDAVLTLALAHT